MWGNLLIWSTVEIWRFRMTYDDTCFTKWTYDLGSLPEKGYYTHWLYGKERWRFSGTIFSDDPMKYYERQTWKKTSKDVYGEMHTCFFKFWHPYVGHFYEPSWWIESRGYPTWMILTFESFASLRRDHLKVWGSTKTPPIGCMELSEIQCRIPSAIKSQVQCWIYSLGQTMEILPVSCSSLILQSSIGDDFHIEGRKPWRDQWSDNERFISYKWDIKHDWLSYHYPTIVRG